MTSKRAVAQSFMACADVMRDGDDPVDEAAQFIYAVRHAVSGGRSSDDLNGMGKTAVKVFNAVYPDVFRWHGPAEASTVLSLLDDLLVRTWNVDGAEALITILTKWGSRNAPDVEVSPLHDIVRSLLDRKAAASATAEIFAPPPYEPDADDLTFAETRLRAFISKLEVVMRETAMLHDIKIKDFGVSMSTFDEMPSDYMGWSYTYDADDDTAYGKALPPEISKKLDSALRELGVLMQHQLEWEELVALPDLEAIALDPVFTNMRDGKVMVQLLCENGAIERAGEFAGFIGEASGLLGSDVVRDYARQLAQRPWIDHVISLEARANNRTVSTSFEQPHG